MTNKQLADRLDHLMSDRESPPSTTHRARSRSAHVGRLLRPPALVPLAAGPTVAVVAILALSKTVEGITDTVANIHQWSLRQVVTPDHLAGRVTAGHRFAVYGAGAAGALAGGALGTAVGLRPALLVCAVGALLSPLLALCSPLRQLRQQPTPDRLTF